MQRSTAKLSACYAKRGATTFNKKIRLMRIGVLLIPLLSTAGRVGGGPRDVLRPESSGDGPKAHLF